MIARTSLVTGLVAFGLLLPYGRDASAQAPFPTAFMRSTQAGAPEPIDGADVLVVYGLGVGLGTCRSPTLNETLYITLLAVNSGRRTITEVTPQSNCSSNINDWKYAITSLVNQVIAGAPQAGTYWGGVMLDEEDGFWAGDAVAAFTDLNAHVRSVVSEAPGNIWYYTETFTGQGNWSQNQFNQVTGASVPAPQIASDYMIGLTNTLPPADVPVLVTWSLVYPADYASLYRASSRISHPTYSKWGLNLSNCFTPGLSPPCGPDTDHDGLVSGIENLIGTLPTAADSDIDGCSDGEETGLFDNRGGMRTATSTWDFYDVPAPANGPVAPDGKLTLSPTASRNRAVNLSDNGVILQYVGRTSTNELAYYYNSDLNSDGIADGVQLDRTPSTDPNQPWRSGPPNGAIALNDVGVNLSQVGDTCIASP